MFAPRPSRLEQRVRAASRRLQIAPPTWSLVAAAAVTLLSSPCEAGSQLSGRTLDGPPAFTICA